MVGPFLRLIPTAMTETIKDTLSQKSRRHRAFRLFLWTGGTALCLIGIGVAAVYFLPAMFLKPQFGRLVFLPVAIVDGHMVSFRDVALRREITARIAQTEGMDIPDERTTAAKLFEETAIERIAQASGFAVTPELLSKETARVESLLFAGDQERRSRTVLSKREREIHLIIPYLYREKASSLFEQETGPDRKAAREALVRAGDRIRSGQEEKEDETVVSRAGEWLDGRYIDAPVRTALDGLAPNTWSGVVETEQGYHFLKLLERKTEDGQIFYRIDRLTAAKPRFADWLAERTRAMSLTVFVSALR